MDEDCVPLAQLRLASWRAGSVLRKPLTKERSCLRAA
jgi:hypothetical protein